MAANRLNQLLESAGSPPLDAGTGGKFAAYLALLQRWNARTNLTAVRDEEGILSRHFVESILCARMLPDGIASLLDFGSGAGFPGLPIALLRPEIRVTLAESQHKKAAFLREAVRVLGIPVAVHAARAETLGARFDCVTLRAVDDMRTAVSAAAELLTPAGWLASLTTVNAAEADPADPADPARQAHPAQAGAPGGFLWQPARRLPPSANRVLLLGQRVAAERG